MSTQKELREIAHVHQINADAAGALKALMAGRVVGTSISSIANNFALTIPDDVQYDRWVVNMGPGKLPWQLFQLSEKRQK